MTQANGRTSAHPVDPLFLERWSPRAFTGEAMPAATLMSLLEAARWAPSSYNSQPWRFVYALRGTPHWDRLFGLLNEFNQSWARNASALVVIVSSETMVRPGTDTAVPSHSHSFDAGAAWAQLALQATRSGWQAHGMVGFDMARAATELKVPSGFRVEMALAIGKQGDPATLSDALRAREVPSDRKPLAEIAFEGAFAG